MFLLYLMKIQILKSKLHRAKIREVHLDYEGSCAIDEELLEAASINQYEMIHKFVHKPLLHICLLYLMFFDK